MPIAAKQSSADFHDDVVENHDENRELTMLVDEVDKSTTKILLDRRPR
jgi:hypothetical protein